jgi:hypothetical protein
VENFGKTQRQGIIDSLTSQGADSAAIQELRILDEQLTALEEHAKQIDLGKSLAESLMTPLDKFTAKEREISRLMDKDVMGDNAIDEKTAKKAFEQNQKDYEQATGVTALYDQTRTAEEKLQAALAKLDAMKAAGDFVGQGDLYDRARKAAIEQYTPKKEKEQAKPAAFEGLDSLYKRIASSAAGRRPEERTAEATEKLVAESRKTNDKLDKLSQVKQEPLVARAG